MHFLAIASASPISAPSSQQHRRRPLKNLALACQPESRTAKVCRLPVARSATFLKFEEYHLPTLLVFAASPADRAAPRKLAYQEIAESTGDTETPETGPGVERARILPLALLSSPTVGVMALAPLCTAHIFAIRAQSCTNEKSPLAPRPRITITNQYYLKEIGFFRKYRAMPAREGWQVTSNLRLICVHLRSSLRPLPFLFYVRTIRASCVRSQFSFPGVSALWRSRLSIRKTACNPPQPVCIRDAPGQKPNRPA